MWVNLRSKRGPRVRPLRSCESLERAGILFDQLCHLLQCFQQGNHEIWFTYITSNIRNSFSLMFDNSYLGTAPEAGYHQSSNWDNRWGERGKEYSWEELELKLYHTLLHGNIPVKKMGTFDTVLILTKICVLPTWESFVGYKHVLIYLLQLITDGVIMGWLH